MFDSLEIQIRDELLLERELKSGEKSVVSILREKATGTRYVCHCFRGSGEAYEALQGVDCPNLPRVEKVARRDETVLVLEEYIQGDTLSFLLEVSPLGEEQARETLIQICQGLKILHDRGVVHRDIKPENIILRGDEAVLIDFDVSRVCKPEQNIDTRVMGTAGYAAPEQFGFSQTDARADIFSLGVLLNEMLIRRHPSQELADGPLRPIIEKCIEVNVDKRYASVDELLEALSAPHAKKTKPWRRWLVPALLALLAVGAVHMFLFAMNAEKDKPLPAAEVGQAEKERPVFVEPESEEKKAVPAEAAQSQKTPLELSKILWHGDPGVYATEFQYDLDDDGVCETYVFAAMFDFAGVPCLLQHSGSAINDRPEVLNVVGAVWKQVGENEYEPVEEFAVRLTDCVVAVRQIEGEAAGEVELIGALYGVWPGAVCATFDSVGYWYYECSAVLGGETLTAVGATRTELLAEVAPAPTPIKPNSIDSAPLLAMLRTDGTPIGEPIPLQFDIRDELKRGTYRFYNFTAQYLDNGHIRFALDYFVPKIQSIVAFDPPDGALFRYSDRSGTSGERELLVFDLPEEQLQTAGCFTITFNCGEDGRFLIFVDESTVLQIVQQTHR